MALWSGYGLVLVVVWFVTVETSEGTSSSLWRQDDACEQEAVAKLTEGTPIDQLPSWAELPPGYSMHRPQGTSCADGSPFFLLVTKKSEEDLLVFYEEGGACFEYDSCCGQKMKYDPNTGINISVAAKISCGVIPPITILSNGVLSPEPTNPFLNYSVIYAQYCTGDLWGGHANATYTKDGKSCDIHHAGTGNGKVISDWILQSWRATLKRVTVMGKAEGGYGAVFHGAALAKRLEDANLDIEVSILSDSAIGAVHFPDPWKVEDGIVGDLTGPRGFLDVSFSSSPVNLSSARLAYRTLVGEISAYFPCLRIAEFTTRNDRKQTIFYGLSGASTFPDACPGRNCSSQWPNLVESSFNLTESLAGDRYRAMIANGTSHTIIAERSFYTETGTIFENKSAGLVKVVQFVQDYVVGDGSVCRSNGSLIPSPPPAATRAPTAGPSSSASAAPSSSLEPSDSGTMPSPSSDPLTPSPSDSGNNGVCFPSDALVEVFGRGKIAIVEVRLGDRILSSDGNYAETFFFSHFDPSVMSEFVELTTVESVNPLSLSPTHFLPVGSSGNLVQAKDVRIGDVLLGPNRDFVAVKSIRRVRKVGLVTPHVVGTSEIVVNGVLSSTWTAAIPPRLAGALLSPLEAFYRLTGIGFVLRRPQSALDIARSVSLVPESWRKVLEPSVDRHCRAATFPVCSTQH